MCCRWTPFSFLFHLISYNSFLLTYLLSRTVAHCFHCDVGWCWWRKGALSSMPSRLTTLQKFHFNMIIYRPALVKCLFSFFLHFKYFLAFFLCVIFFFFFCHISFFPFLNHAVITFLYICMYKKHSIFCNGKIFIYEALTQEDIN